MGKQTPHIRNYVVLAGFSLAIAAAGGCSETANPLQPAQFSEERSATASAHTVSEPSFEADFAVGPELAAVRRATAAFHNVAKAEAAGYSTAGEPCIASPAGTMGVHAPNPALIATQTLDPERPELLLYLAKPNGGFRLIAVEYFQVVLLRNTVTGAVGPWVSSGPWPTSYQVVTTTPQLFGQTFQGPMPGHTPTMPWHWDLHVWVWAHNPSGMFALFNPALQC